jgi:propionyl-CoA carboxylase alpha chain
VLGGLPSGWRNLPSQPQRKAFTGLLGAHEVAYRLTRDGLHAEGFEDVRLVSAEPGEVVLEADGVRHALLVARYGERVEVDSALGPVTLTAVPRFADPADHVAAGSLLAPMPGSVVSVLVAEGDPVERGAPLLVLEAMKMQHSVPAPADGVVASLRVRPGTQVEAGAVLAVVVPAEDFEPSEPSEPEET